MHAAEISVVVAQLGAALTGLTSVEASARLGGFGPNELPPPRRVPAAAILLAQLRSVVVFLLVVAAAVSGALGNVIEALAIGAVLIINTTLGFVSELRARRAMERILGIEVPKAWVFRDGLLRVIDARDVVPGDVIELTGGRQVPADARLIEAVDLRSDEAALTGESLPVSKQASAAVAMDTPLADRVTMVYKGTTAVTGVGRGIVTATGARTEVGRIGMLTASVTTAPTPLERRLDALGHRLVWVAVAAGAGVAALAAAQGSTVEIVIETGLALAIAAVPEALPAVATIALAVGMRRMAVRRALVRRLPAVESLGSTTVVCTDKTRTLTSGDMSVVDIRGPADARRVLEIAALASRPQPEVAEGMATGRDPVDAAVLSAASKAGIDWAARQRRDLVGLVPFSSERKLMAAFHRVNGTIVASVKGAPRQVLALCDLNNQEANGLLATNDAMARSGHRVLGVAEGPVPAAAADALRGITFAGFVGLADPPAPGVKDTIARLRTAGLRTVMLTGDQRLTAEVVGRAVGVLDADDRVLEARDLDAMDDGELRAVVGATGAFGRITPEHKLRIVRALQAQGEIVAMLGDGVNDAPALRQADVGVAMGIRGTDVAKDAAAIVLQDDRFETIAAAVEEGRVIFDNIRKFVLYLFSCNTAEILVLLTAGLFGLPLPLLPLQLLWLNMVTDTFPAVALAMEPGDSDTMLRPPRSPEEAILSRAFLASLGFYGALITMATLAAYAWGLEHAPDRANTAAFMTLAFAQILHLGNARSAEPVMHPRRALANTYAIMGAALAIVLQVATVVIAPLASVLRLTPLGINEWAIVVACGAAPAVAGQGLKRVRPHL